MPSIKRKASTPRRPGATRATRPPKRRDGRAGTHHALLEQLMLGALSDPLMPTDVVDCATWCSREAADGGAHEVLLRVLVRTIVTHDGWLSGDLHARASEILLYLDQAVLSFDPPICRGRLCLVR